MGHVKEKKSTRSNNSSPPETLSIAEAVNSKEKPTAREQRLSQQPSLSNLRDPTYPEQLNAEELISQINCRSTNNEISNDTNNNFNNNNNTSNRPSNNQQQQQQQPRNRQHQPQQQHEQVDEQNAVDVENGPTIEKKHHRQRPLHRRLISYIRNLWIGARLNVGSTGKHENVIT